MKKERNLKMMWEIVLIIIKKFFVVLKSTVMLGLNEYEKYSFVVVIKKVNIFLNYINNVNYIIPKREN